MAYDTSIADFEQSAKYMEQAIEAQKAREQTSEVQQTIDDLSTMREDILNKIAEVRDTKQLVNYSVKKFNSNSGIYNFWNLLFFTAQKQFDVEEWWLHCIIG